MRVIPIAPPRWLLCAGCALALFAAEAIPAFAAINASLVPTTVRSGDWVVLTTATGAGGSDVYAPIATAGPTPVFLQRAGPASGGNSCETHVGAMTWANGVGTLRFQVPDVSQGTYWIMATVQGACWRFGDPSNGVLALTVLPGETPGLPLALFTLVVGIVLLFVVGAAVVRRRGGERR